MTDHQKVVFIDGVGAGRSSIESCRDGVQWIRVGDRVYWPLSDADAQRLHSACCGNGSFDGPSTVVQPEASTTLEQAESHAHICAKLAEEHKDDVLVCVALTDAAAIIRDLMRELRRETERRWEGNRRAAQEYVEDMRDVLREAAQVCKDLDDEALAKESRLACGAECAAAIADLAARMNVPFGEHEHDR